MTLNDYLAMLSGENRGKAKFMALMNAVLTQVVDLQSVVNQISVANSIDAASGEQLDTIASALGISRLDTTAGVLISDDAFRDYIKKKLICWSWDGTYKHAQELAAKISANCNYRDNQNGTVTISSAGTQPAALEKVFPVSAGVRVV